MKNFLSVLFILLSAFILRAENITCQVKDGFARHLQGIACNESGIFWDFTGEIVKTDWQGKIIARANVQNGAHGGDITLDDRGHLFVSVAVEPWNKRLIKEYGEKRGWIWEFDSELKFVGKTYLPGTLPDGITFLNGKFYVASDTYGKAPHPENDLHIYDRNFKLLAKKRISLGKDTNYGAQTLCVWKSSKILASFYTKNPASFVIDPETGRIEFPITQKGFFGTAFIPEKIAGSNDLILIAWVWNLKKADGKKNKNTCMGTCTVYRVTEKNELVHASLPKKK